MEKFYIVNGIEVIIFIIIAIIINQPIHNLLKRKKLNFITPLLNTIIVLCLLNIYKNCIKKITSIPNVYLPIESSVLIKISNIIAGIIIFVFIIQFFKSIFKKMAKTSESLQENELPKFKPGLDITQNEKKEYPLPTDLNFKVCPYCNSKNIEVATECSACKASFTK